MKKYRILITISELMYSSQVRNLCDLVSMLDKDRFDIEIGALATGDEAHADVEKLGVKVYRLRLLPTRKFSLSNLVDLVKGPFIIAFKQYDLVHSLLYQAPFTEPLFFKALTRTKYVYTKSNLEWENHPMNWRWKSRLSDRIVSISAATDKLLDEKGFGDKKVKIFLGIDTDHFVHSDRDRSRLRAQHGIPDDAVVLGCAAQFIEWKEHLTVFRAFCRLAEKYPNAYLLYCGPNHNDAYYHEVVNEISSSQFGHRVRLLGTLSDMPSFYSAIDCFVLASRFETFGYVYVEAMSCHRPVIGCRAAGPLEIIAEGETGFFSKMSDPSDLAVQIEKYLVSPELIERHGAAARKRVIDIFSKEVMARRTQDLYLEMLESG